MVVEVYQQGRAWTFLRPARATERLLIEAPAGSELLPVATVGPRLFVPADRLVRLAWDAGEVVRAAKGRQGAFRLV